MMKKIIFVVFAIGLDIGLGIGLGIGLALFLSKPKANPQIMADFNMTCDLNTQKCDNASGIGFEFDPRPIEAMTPFMVHISNLPSKLNEPNARIYGLNMDMGTIKVALKPNAKGYEAKVVLSTCVMSKMEYRLELYDGDKSTGEYIDFILFQ